MSDARSVGISMIVHSIDVAFFAFSLLTGPAAAAAALLAACSASGSSGDATAGCASAMVDRPTLALTAPPSARR